MLKRSGLAELKARVRKRDKVTTDSDHDQPIADNLLKQKLHRRAAESTLGQCKAEYERSRP